MNFSELEHTDAGAAIRLFQTTFTASEGPGEGALIAELAENLLTGTPAADRRAFGAADDGRLAGAIIFSRLTYRNDPRCVFVLGPVAVMPACQRRGVGQGVIRHGLAALRNSGVDIALTYGDPGYYRRIGFYPVTEEQAPAPYRLQHPEGWLGQSLTGAAFAPLKGPVASVPAFRNPAYW